MIAANPAYDRARALVKELRHNLRAMIQKSTRIFVEAYCHIPKIPL